MGRQSEIIEPLKILEPRLKRMSIQMRGIQAVIHGEINNRLVPIPFMGEGIARLTSILLAIADAANGVVLLDEAENGFHYSVLGETWKAIAVAARRSNTQVFATTHSLECINAANATFANGGAEDFRFFRLERRDDTFMAVASDHEMLSGALHANLEVR